MFCSLSIPVDSTSSCVVIRLNIFTLGRRIGYPIDSWPYIIHLTQQPRPSPYNKQGFCPHIMTSLRVSYEFQGPDEGTRGGLYLLVGTLRLPERWFHCFIRLPFQGSKGRFPRFKVQGCTLRRRMGRNDLKRYLGMLPYVFLRR